MIEDFYSGVKFYRFCPGIPWTFENGVLNFALSKEVWDNLIVGKEAYVLFPGYFLESLFLPLFIKILKANDIKIKGVIAPEYYNNFFNYFNIKNIAKDETDLIFKEYDRLDNAIKGYPTPIFMDREDNIYFNMLHSYGKRLNFKGGFIERDNTLFWQQILRNTCCYPYNLAYPIFDKDELKKRLNKYLVKFGINLNLPYVIIDYCSFDYVAADGRKIVLKPFTDIKLKNLASVLFHKKYQVIVLNSKPAYYGLSNIYKLPNWFNIKPDTLMGLLLYASGVFSLDPNIYLSAAFLGCLKVFAGGNFQEGFCLQDIEGISLSNKKKKWINREENDINLVIKELTEF